MKALLKALFGCKISWTLKIALNVESFGTLEAVSKGFTDAMASEANIKLKLCKQHAQRVYEILRLHYVQKLFSRPCLSN